MVRLSDALSVWNYNFVVILLVVAHMSALQILHGVLAGEWTTCLLCCPHIIFFFWNFDLCSMYLKNYQSPTELCCLYLEKNVGSSCFWLFSFFSPVLVFPEFLTLSCSSVQQNICSNLPYVNFSFVLLQSVYWSNDSSVVHLCRRDSRVVGLIKCVGAQASPKQRRVLCMNKIDLVEKKKDLSNVLEEFQDLPGYDRYGFHINWKQIVLSFAFCPLQRYENWQFWLLSWYSSAL